MSLEGYTSNIENDICSRCFRMKNYGEYQIVTKSNDEYIEILKEVDKTKDLVLYIVDALNIGEDIKSIRQYISNNMILVLNKRDVLPKSVKDNKLIWSIPDDLKFFKETTNHHTIIMGRKTFESLPRMLPNRKHIVLLELLHSLRVYYLCPARCGER